MERIACTLRLQQDDTTSACAFALPFDPKEKFGKVRVPVVVTIGTYSYRTTVAAMGGQYWIVVNKGNREAAGVKAGDRVRVEIVLDAAPRVVKAPDDLEGLLQADRAAAAVWKKLSFTHQREYAQWIDEAKRPETRARRLRSIIEKLRERT